MSNIEIHPKGPFGKAKPGSFLELANQDDTPPAWAGAIALTALFVIATWLIASSFETAITEFNEIRLDTWESYR